MIGLSLWSHPRTNPKSEVTHCVTQLVSLNLLFIAVKSEKGSRTHFWQDGMLTSISHAIVINFETF